MFVNKVTSDEKVGSKLIDNVKVYNMYLTSDFNQKVDCSRDIYAVVVCVSNSNVCSRMLDKVTLTSMDDILSDEA